METDTMSKLEKVFDTPNKKAFIGFLTAGDPDADSTVQFILEMEKAGADLIEIGIPEIIFTIILLISLSPYV